MAERRCTFKCGDWNCGSYQFNLYKADIDQGDLCDVHYWQTKAQREWVGLDVDEFKFIASKYLLNREAGIFYFKEEIEAKLKEKNT